MLFFTMKQCHGVVVLLCFAQLAKTKKKGENSEQKKTPKITLFEFFSSFFLFFMSM